MGDIVLLDRFFSQIQLHLVSCYQEVSQWPVIMGIFGRSGDGKSAQLVASLQRCEVEIIRLNAADLESGLAGEPGKHLARTYAAASLAVAKEIPTALVLDDIDTTVGEWEMNTGTVNHQQVLAELMHIADRPVDLSRNHPRKVPVFVTGNNLARLYPPLRRPGRMRSMSWRPTNEELVQVVQGLFRDVAPPVELAEFAMKFRDETLAFFAEVRQTQREVEMRRRLGDGHVDMRKLLSHGRPGEQSARPMRMQGPELARLAEAVRDSHDAALEDFIKEPGRR
jgi:SpoVK/Ycf46/Vps4 family AAA+-type ATPase